MLHAKRMYQAAVAAAHDDQSDQRARAKEEMLQHVVHRQKRLTDVHMDTRDDGASPFRSSDGAESAVGT